MRAAKMRRYAKRVFIAPHRPAIFAQDAEHKQTRAEAEATYHAMIEAYTSLELMDAFDNPNLDKTMKWDSRYARQNGIHFSPTFMIDSIIRPDMSSGDAVADWIAKLA